MTRGVRHHLGARALAKNQHELVEDEEPVISFLPKKSMDMAARPVPSRRAPGERAQPQRSELLAKHCDESWRRDVGAHDFIVNRIWEYGSLELLSHCRAAPPAAKKMKHESPSTGATHTRLRAAGHVMESTTPRLPGTRTQTERRTRRPSTA